MPASDLKAEPVAIPDNVPRFSSEKVLEIAKRMGNDPDVLWAQETNESSKFIHGRSHPPCMRRKS